MGTGLSQISMALFFIFLRLQSVTRQLDFYMYISNTNANESTHDWWIYKDLSIRMRYVHIFMCACRLDNYKHKHEDPI